MLSRWTETSLAQTLGSQSLSLRHIFDDAQNIRDYSVFERDPTLAAWVLVHVPSKSAIILVMSVARGDRDGLDCGRYEKKSSSGPAVRNPGLIADLHAVDVILSDKTGTITTGKKKVCRCLIKINHFFGGALFTRGSSVVYLGT